MNSRIASRLLSLVLLLPALPAAVYANDCAAKPQAIERALCSQPQLRSADAAMSAAYVRQLAAAGEPAFREAVLNSQRRWLEAREKLARTAEHPQDADTKRPDLAEITRGRTRALEEGLLLRNLEQQRAFWAGTDFGAHSGLAVDCFIAPPPYAGWDYICMGARHAERQGRLCSESQDWASGKVVDHRLVSAIRNGVAEPVASCSIGGGNEPCPGRFAPAPEAGWNWQPTLKALAPPRPGSLRRYDADYSVDPADDGWINQCLSAPSYP